MHTTPSRAARLLLSVALLALAGGCRHTAGNFVWVDDVEVPAQAERAASYVIRPGDVIAVQVYQQEQMSTRGRVRQDGRISVPFLKDVVAAGYTPNALAEQLQTRFKDFVNNPVVTVSLDTALPLTVSVMGEVARPGSYALEPGAGVFAALAAAGDLTDYAQEDSIYVLRPRAGGPVQRIRFHYEALSRGEGKAAAFVLEHGDAVVVE